MALMYIFWEEDTNRKKTGKNDDDDSFHPWKSPVDHDVQEIFKDTIQTSLF